ncbi:MAG: LytTR family DNA-binding domain-containing protein [Boseongicola sp.]|nr:LytTR family DNA-binding domain-containing protein [Boseongicola sp.]
MSDLKNPANRTPMQLTLRQLRKNLSSPFFWMVLGAVILLASMAGPYFTLERFSFPERVVYWGTTLTLSAILMTFLSVHAHRLAVSHAMHWSLVATLAGVAGVLPIVATVYLAEALVTGFAPGWFMSYRPATLIAHVALSAVAVTLIVNAMIEFRERERANLPSGPAAEGKPRATTPTLLQSRLPHHLGHDIVSVKAQDHYVEVTTPKGSATVLMRLGDAIADLEPLNGLQVHRSWWINLSHVVETKRGPSGPELMLASDQTVPVGRSFRKAFREAAQRQPARTRAGSSE